MAKNEHAVAMGRKGGKVWSKDKERTALENLAKARENRWPYQRSSNYRNGAKRGRK